MPLTKEGRKVKKSLQEHYGERKGEDVFYASINKGKKGSSKWHSKSKTKRKRS